VRQAAKVVLLEDHAGFGLRDRPRQPNPTRGGSALSRR
jgi:hypothetical protein